MYHNYFHFLLFFFDTISFYFLGYFVIDTNWVGMIMTNVEMIKINYVSDLRDSWNMQIFGLVCVMKRA